MSRQPANLGQASAKGRLCPLPSKRIRIATSGGSRRGAALMVAS